MVRATIEGLTRLQTVEHVAALRGKSVEELLRMKREEKNMTLKVTPNS